MTVSQEGGGREGWEGVELGGVGAVERGPHGCLACVLWVQQAAPALELGLGAWKARF